MSSGRNYSAETLHVLARRSSLKKALGLLIAFVFAFTAPLSFAQTLTISNDPVAAPHYTLQDNIETNSVAIMVEGDAILSASIIAEYLDSGINVDVISEGSVYFEASVILQPAASWIQVAPACWSVNLICLLERACWWV